MSIPFAALPRRRQPRLLAAFALLAGLLSNLGPAQMAYAATITVTTTADELNADGDCSLREAIRAANLDTSVDACLAGSGADTITLAAGSYTLSIAGRNDDAALTGDLDLSGNLTINGAGAATTIINGGRIDRVFNVLAAATVTLSGVTIRNGYAYNQPQTVGDWEYQDSAYGGGIENKGTLTLRASVVHNNTAAPQGGGIENLGTMTIETSTIRNNAVESTVDTGPEGGGIENQGILTIRNSSIVDNTQGSVGGGGLMNLGGTTSLIASIVAGNTGQNGGGISNTGRMDVVDSVIQGNNASGYGGGIDNQETLNVTNSLISGNTSGEAGGLFNWYNGVATITSSTISGNRARIGGAIENSETLSLSNSTIAYNTASVSSGGIVSGWAGSPGIITIRNSLVALNSAPAGTPPDCSGPLTSQGYNLIGNASGCSFGGDTTGNKLGVAPLLGPLQNNGGPAPTHALLPGSPAIDAGNPGTPGSGGNACPATDQRGVARPLDGNGDGVARCDIGAVERQDNLLINGGFEADTNGDGTPDGWSSNSHVTRSSAVVQSGAYALRHRATDNASYTIFSDPAVPIVAGQLYSVSGWVNIPSTAATSSLEFQIRWRDASGNILSTVPVKTYSASTSGWTSFNAALIAPPNATQATIRQVVASLNTTIYVDSLALRAVDNLLVNNGFEADTNGDGTPDGWSSNSHVTRSSDVIHSGAYALWHRATDNASYTIFSDPTVPIVAGQPYNVGGWVNIPSTAATSSLEFQIRWRDASGNILSTVPVKTCSASTSGWTSFSATLVAPPSATQATIRQVVTSLNTTIYVDDLVFGP